MSTERINLSGGNFFEGWSDEAVDVYKADLYKLAVDITGTLAKLPDHLQREYRDAEESVRRARNAAPSREGLIVLD